MSVWDTLIGLTATALKNKPRSDVLNALFELRAAMHACNRTYTDLQIMVRLGDYDSQMAERQRVTALEPGLKVYDPRKEWAASVVLLCGTLDSIGTTLHVLNPKAFEEVAQYQYSEFRASSEAEDPYGPYHASMKVLTKYDARIDLDRPFPRSSFKRAVEQLDNLIRTHFKPEELFQAAKRVREWPYPYVFYGEYWLKYAP